MFCTSHERKWAADKMFHVDYNWYLPVTCTHITIWRSSKKCKRRSRSVCLRLRLWLVVWRHSRKIFKKGYKRKSSVIKLNAVHFFQQLVEICCFSLLPPASFYLIFYAYPYRKVASTLITSPISSLYALGSLKCGGCSVLMAQSCCWNVWKGHIFQTVFKSKNLPVIHWPPAVQFKPVTMCWYNAVSCKFKLNHCQYKHAYFLCKLGLLDCFLFANCLVLLPPTESRWQMKLH